MPPFVVFFMLARPSPSALKMPGDFPEQLSLPICLRNWSLRMQGWAVNELGSSVPYWTPNYMMVKD